MTELKGTKIIAIDHGYGNIKTANTVTPTAITAYDSPPVFTGNILEYEGKWYRIGEGHKEFTAIAIVGGKGDELAPFCAPCGVCRQVLAEFCDQDFKLVLGTPNAYTVHSFCEILPYSFGKKDLE